MKTLELYPSGSFGSWDPRKIQEFKAEQGNKSFAGGNLMFENEYLKLWEISLYPGERIPFSKKNSNYLWTCISGGQTLSHYGDGAIRYYVIEKGESCFYEFKDSNHISDLENTGKNIIVIHIIEYKHEEFNAP